MKKTIITLLALAGTVMANQTNFLDLSKTSTIDTLTYDSTTSLITTTTLPNNVNGDYNLYEINNAGLQTILTFKINLDKASSLNASTTIFTLDFKDKDADIGLVATETGLSASLGGSTEGRSSVTWDTLEALTYSTIGADGDKYLVLTLAHIPAQQAGLGTALYSSSSTGTLFSDVDSRYSAKTDVLTSIYVNPELVAAVQVNSSWGDGPASYVEPFVTTSAGSLTIPEPTTATLSLLALAGLAARRRRR